METKIKKPNILKYDDYRKFLQDWYAWMKDVNSVFSYRAFSKWAGFKSPNHLQLIIKGKRNITKSTLPAILKVLKLKKKGETYFELLVDFNQADTQESKARYLKELSAFYKKHGHLLKHSQYEYLSKWYFPVVRELVTTKNFRDKPQSIAKRIGHDVTPKQVREAIEKLIELKLLKREENGFLAQSPSVVSTGPESYETAVYMYHDQMLKMAGVALREQPPEERNFAGITFACRKEDIADIADIVNDFRKQIINYLENRDKKDEDDDVYQLGVQVFCLTSQGDKK